MENRLLPLGFVAFGSGRLLVPEEVVFEEPKRPLGAGAWVVLLFEETLLVPKRLPDVIAGSVDAVTRPIEEDLAVVRGAVGDEANGPLSADGGLGVLKRKSLFAEGPK